ncbi:tetratricopeptide repeat protein [Corynebacterium sp. YSMAA1_1_D6]|uniref:tetratricopeptide repeat protein n=1 Tax=Corynebacterium sp. YSMAA1_1_D6 TaxID=3383589 RepID=UPI0038D1C842
MNLPLNPYFHVTLQKLGDDAISAWNRGDTIAAHVLSREFWESLPAPKGRWTTVASVPVLFSFIAAVRGDSEYARLWRDRSRALYMEPHCDISNPGFEGILLFVDGVLAYEEGDERAAVAAFAESYLKSSRRAFRGSATKYLDLLLPHITPDLYGIVNPDELFDMGNDELLKGNFAGAIAIWEHALDLLKAPSVSKDSATFHAALATTFFVLGRFGEAITHAHAANDIGGSNTALMWLRIGQCHFERGDNDAAAEALGKAEEVGGQDIWKGEDPTYYYFLAGRRRA